MGTEIWLEDQLGMQITNHMFHAKYLEGILRMEGVYREILKRDMTRLDSCASSAL